MLNTIEAIKTRYSGRAFTEKISSDADLQIIAESAVCAPSAMNMQPWRVIIVKNKKLLDEFETEGMKNIAVLPDKSTYERITSRVAGRQAVLRHALPVYNCIALNKLGKWHGIDCGIITN